MRVYIETFGCKVNFAESSDISNIIENSGHQITDNPIEADLFIINSCSVTNRAEREIRQVSRRFHNIKPEAKVIITGCSIFSESFLNRKSEIDFVTLIPQKDLPNILNLKEEKSGEYRFTKSRPFIKIQNGCDRFCSYCIVPYLRGRPYSLSLSDIMNKIEYAINNDYQEIVLVGTHIMLYKDPLSGTDIFGLLQRIDNLDSPFRMRLSSIEPYGLEDKEINYLSKLTRLCGHFHIALQSGSDRILKDMNRNYKKEDFYDIVNKIKDKIPEATIGTDIIVGFPSETESDFEETLKFIESLPVDYLHIFRFSARKNTPAYNLKQVSTDSEIKRRSKILKEISLYKRKNMIAKYAGKVMDVLITHNEKGYSSGLTHNYIKVKIMTENLKKGRLFKVRLNQEIYDNMILGELYEK